MSRSKKTYFSPAQIRFLAAKQKMKIIIAGRGWGKSTAIAASCYNKATKMPGSKGFFSASTYAQILNKMMPAIEGKWQEWGLKEGIHYVIGRKPPAHFKRPVAPPNTHKHVISWVNGSCQEMQSMDRPDAGRGGSYDYGEVDEAALVSKKHIDSVLLPTLRGNLRRYRTHLLHSICFYTSMPRKSKGMWVLDLKDQALAYPDDIYYQEGSAMENLAILGDDYIERHRKTLPHIEFMMEIMNVMQTKLPDGFYPAFDRDRHTYQPRYIYTSGAKGIEVKGTKCGNPKKHLDISMDFSGWFQCATVWQEERNVEKCLHQFHVKGNEKIKDLVDQICEHYKDHKLKYVRLYGEPRGHDRNAYGPTIWDQIVKRFARHGWDAEVIVKPGTQVMSHQQRHEMMDEVLREDDTRMPSLRFNEDMAANVIISIENTDITKDFKKNKSKEKDRDYPQENAPHYSDTVDYFIEQKYGWKWTGGGEYVGGGDVVFG